MRPGRLRGLRGARPGGPTEGRRGHGPCGRRHMRAGPSRRQVRAQHGCSPACSVGAGEGSAGEGRRAQPAWQAHRGGSAWNVQEGASGARRAVRPRSLTTPATTCGGDAVHSRWTPPGRGKYLKEARVWRLEWLGSPCLASTSPLLTVFPGFDPKCATPPPILNAETGGDVKELTDALGVHRRHGWIYTRLSERRLSQILFAWTWAHSWSNVTSEDY